LIKVKDSIFATPTEKKGEFIARLTYRLKQGFKPKGKEKKEINFFKKACGNKKKLYFCSRFQGEH